MEGQPMVSYWTGSMNSLVDKLTKLKDRPKIIEELLEDLVSLKRGFFDKLAARQETNLQLQVRAWMNHVRELVADIEDWIDQKPGVTKDMWHHSAIQQEVNSFKAQIEHACELFTRYDFAMELSTDAADVADVAPARKTSDYPPWIFEERSAKLVDIEDSSSYLEECLKDDEDMMLKVVSIVGIEGSGKTSLAKEVYARLQGQFDCQAFVSAGRRLSARTILLNILHQVKLGSIPPDGRRTSQDLHEIITELWEYLGTKRYFILVDGLWSTRAWKVISCALRDKNCGSRVLTTTCIMNVAKFCSMHPSDALYSMKGFSKDNSTILFLQSIRAEDGGPADIPEVSADLIKNCDGMPLAIIVAAGLLYKKSIELTDVMMVRKSILSLLEQHSTKEGMTKILDMSYADMSIPVKSCFLYLTVFPEDYTIRKDRLIWLWGAEGFLPNEDEECLWVTGERYFNELIMRGLIQPVFDYDDDKSVGCTVHGVIHDFIRSLLSKENFATTGADLGSSIFSCSTDAVRRLSLDCCRDKADILTSNTVHLLSMRSLIVFGDIEEKAGRSALAVAGGEPVLQAFKLLRVLDLEDADNLMSHHLEGIAGLVLLKYLGLRRTSIDALPEEVGELEHLEVLDVRQTKLSTLPTSVFGLKRLVRILLDGAVNLPRSIYEMGGMEEVSTIGVDGSSSLLLAVNLLSWSRRLRVLGLTLAEVTPISADSEERIRKFLSKVSRSDIRSLSLQHLHGNFVSYLSIVSRSHFSKLELTISRPVSDEAVCGIASGVTHLHIEVDHLTEAGVAALRGLPHLVLLKLVSSGNDIPTTSTRRREERCIISGGLGGFPCLKVFCFTCKAGGTEVQFGSGAMPQLQRLQLGFSAWETLYRYGDFEFGIQHLTRLTRVHATINCEDAIVSEVENAKAAIIEQARKSKISTNKPTAIEFSRELEDKMLDGEKERQDKLEIGNKTVEKKMKAENRSNAKNHFAIGSAHFPPLELSLAGSVLADEQVNGHILRRVLVVNINSIYSSSVRRGLRDSHHSFRCLV